MPRVFYVLRDLATVVRTLLSIRMFILTQWSVVRPVR